MGNPDNPGHKHTPEDEPSAATAAGEHGQSSTDTTGESEQEDTKYQGAQRDTKYQGVQEDTKYQG